MLSIIMRALGGFRRFVDAFVRWLLIISITGVLVFTVAQVADRYIIRGSFSAYDQFARISLVALTFIGIAVGIRDKVNVRIELVSNFVSSGVNRVIDLGLRIAIFLLASIIFFKGIPLLDIGGMQTIMGTPFTYRTMYGLAMFGMVLIMFLLLGSLFRYLCGKDDD